MKKCIGCGLDKDESEFSPKNKEGKLVSRCKPCVNLYNKEYRKSYLPKEKKRIKQRVRNARARNVKSVLEYLLINPCTICGENDPLVLEFDHLDRSLKTANIAKMLTNHSWKNIEEEIKKCRVLCGNCHRRHTARQMGWYMAKLIDGVV